jgi:hypothetical protein
MSVQTLLRAYFLAGLPVGLLAGMALGLLARSEDPPTDAGWTGYSSFERRAVRLAHVAAVMLPALAAVYASALDALPHDATLATWAAALWISGGAVLPIALAAAAWRRPLTPFVPVPALAVSAGAVLFAAAWLHGVRP